MRNLEAVEAAALRSALTSTDRGRVGAVPGGLCLAHPGIPITEFNRVARATRDLDLDAVAAFYEQLGVHYTVSVPPEARSLERALETRGFTRGYAWMKFERTTDEPPSVDTELRVEETTDPGPFDRVAAEGFGISSELLQSFPHVVGRPGWHCFVAWTGEEPASCGTLFVDGDHGWLGIGATRPEHRRRGGQNALLAARIRSARDIGVRLLTTETGERVADRPSGSYRNILRAGFREAYLRPNWLAPE